MIAFLAQTSVDDWIKLAAFAGPGGALVAGIAWWYARKDVEVERSIAREEVAYTKASAKETLAVLASLTSVIKEGDLLGIRGNDKVSSEIREMRHDIRNLAETLRSHHPGMTLPQLSKSPEKQDKTP